MKYRDLTLATLALGAAACSDAPAREPQTPAPRPVNSYGVPYGIWIDDTAATALALRHGANESRPLCVADICSQEQGPTRATPQPANATPDRRPRTR